LGHDLAVHVDRRVWDDKAPERRLVAIVTEQAVSDEDNQYKTDS
jgi:hypothetical protein